MGRLAATLQLRHIGYFVETFQASGLNATADRLGIAHSTLSEALHKLRESVGLPLFDRRNGCLYPTQHGLWLLRDALVLLHLERFARSDPSAIAAPNWIELDADIRFVGGPLARAIQFALQRTLASFPQVLVWPHFPVSPASRPAHRIPDWSPPSPPLARIELRYCSSQGEGAGSAPLSADRWVIVSRRAATGGVSDPPVDVGELRGTSVGLPDLPAPLLEHASRYCEAHGVEVSRWSGEILALDDERDFEGGAVDALMMPEPLLRSRLGDLPIRARRLVPELVSELHVTASAEHPAALAFIDAFRSGLRGGAAPDAFDPQITLRQLRYFDVLVEAESLSAAARGLNVVQPALTQQLALLETAVGAKLVERRSRGGRALGITPAGERMRMISQWMNQTLAVMERQLVALSAHAQGGLRIGVLPSADRSSALLEAVASAVHAWRQCYPGTPVEIVEDHHGGLRDGLARHALHIALLETPADELQNVAIADVEPLGVVSNPECGLVEPGMVALRAIESLPLILPRPGSGIRMLVEAACLAQGVSLVPTIESDSIALNLKLVIENRYCTVLPESAVRGYTTAGVLRFDPIDRPRLTRQMSLSYAPDRSLAPPERALLRLLQESFRAALRRTPPVSGPRIDTRPSVRIPGPDAA